MLHQRYGWDGGYSPTDHKRALEHRLDQLAEEKARLANLKRQVELCKHIVSDSMTEVGHKMAAIGERWRAIDELEG